MNKEIVICFFKTETTEEMMKLIRPVLLLLGKNHHLYFPVYTNTPGEIVYEDKYQVAVKIEGMKVEGTHLGGKRRLNTGAFAAKKTFLSGRKISDYYR